MKSKEELNALKEEVETVSRKLAELTGEEIAQVSGGVVLPGTHDYADLLCGKGMEHPERPIRE